MLMANLGFIDFFNYYIKNGKTICYALTKFILPEIRKWLLLKSLEKSFSSLSFIWNSVQKRLKFHPPTVLICQYRFCRDKVLNSFTFSLFSHFVFSCLSLRLANKVSLESQSAIKPNQLSSDRLIERSSELMVKKISELQCFEPCQKYL